MSNYSDVINGFNKLRELAERVDVPNIGEHFALSDYLREDIEHVLDYLKDDYKDFLCKKCIAVYDSNSLCSFVCFDEEYKFTVFFNANDVSVLRFKGINIDFGFVTPAKYFDVKDGEFTFNIELTSSLQAPYLFNPDLMEHLDGLDFRFSDMEPDLDNPVMYISMYSKKEEAMRDICDVDAKLFMCCMTMPQKLKRANIRKHVMSVLDFSNTDSSVRYLLDAPEVVSVSALRFNWLAIFFGTKHSQSTYGYMLHLSETYIDGHYIPLISDASQYRNNGHVDDAFTECVNYVYSLDNPAHVTPNGTLLELAKIPYSIANENLGSACSIIKKILFDRNNYFTIANLELPPEEEDRINGFNPLNNYIREHAAEMLTVYNQYYIAKSSIKNAIFNVYDLALSATTISDDFITKTPIEQITAPTVHIVTCQKHAIVRLSIKRMIGVATLYNSHTLERSTIVFDLNKWFSKVSLNKLKNKAMPSDRKIKKAKKKHK